MDALASFLAQQDRGFAAVPAIGTITIGGVLAIDGHGASVPAKGEQRPAGTTYGSLSNLVLSLEAVVWNTQSRRYELRTIHRNDPECAAFLTHLGRTFVTEATLRVGAKQTLRCQSFTDIPISELFAHPGTSAQRTFARYLDETGRVEAIWYPFTQNPWLKVWSVSPHKPASSREVTAPYNYPFSDHIPKDIALFSEEQVRTHPESTPPFGQASYDFTVAGLAATDASDIWGDSRNVQVYIRATTLRAHEEGYAVLTRRRDVQRVVAEFASYYSGRIAAYAQRGHYPMNMPVEIRACGLDDPSHSGIAGAAAPSLSAVAPRPDHPEWDVAVWLNVLTFPGTRYANEFYGELERWLSSNYTGEYAMVRPEWSKGWAYTSEGAWTNDHVLAAMPDSFSGTDWRTAVSTLRAADPHGIFTNRFLNRVLR